MPDTLPRLRMDLDFMPSPVPERPGLMIRDPYHYSPSILVVPPALVEFLQFFDGRHTRLDLQEALVRLTGDLKVGELIDHLTATLSEAGFCENDVYAGMKRVCQEQFAVAPRREPAHAGSAYPAEAEELTSVMAEYLDGPARAAAPGPLIGMAAPHVSPEGGWQSYGAAYRVLAPEYKERTFVIVGTSHYGEPERFGLTRKPFVTPLGETRTNQALVDRLVEAGGDAVRLEDYCHAVEHSIEFQVVFLQHLFGPAIEIVPVLCGPFAHSVHDGGLPEKDDEVRRFLGALGELAAREGERLFWVLGVDMAHMGRRYGDPFAAEAADERMTEVAEADRKRLDRICAADAGGFWESVQENRDPLKWCGSAPFYTFLRAVPDTRGHLLRYDQWNIDEQSVVSFGAVAFTSAQAAP